jgi:hypothetical protein
VVVVVAVVLVLVLGASRATAVLVPLLLVLVLVLVPVLAVNLLYYSTSTAETCAERSEIRLLRLDDALMASLA